MIRGPRNSACVKLLVSAAVATAIVGFVMWNTVSLIITSSSPDKEGLREPQTTYRLQVSDLDFPESTAPLSTSADVVTNVVLWEEDDSARVTSSAPTTPETAHDEFMIQRFKQRYRLLNEQCKRLQIQQEATKTPIENRVYSLEYRRLTFCTIYKVGSKFTMNFYFSEHKKLNDEEDFLYFNLTKSYFMVREPYSRMMSGYIDKFISDVLFWNNFGTHIVSLFRQNATVQERQCGSDVTFPEFVKYLIYSQENHELLDPHFIPMSQNCRVCERKYDYVVHLETQADDMEYVLRSVNLAPPEDFTTDEVAIRDKAAQAVREMKHTSACKNPCDMLQSVWWTFQVRGFISTDTPLPVLGESCSTIGDEEFVEVALKAHRDSADNIDRSKQKRDVFKELFSQVPLEDRLRLRELYLPDFELFGYDSTPPDVFPELQDIITTG